jgi:cobalt/nickel transport system permease protein
VAHIPDGVLSLPVLAGGGLLTAAGLALALRKLDEKTIPLTAILSAVFFAGSLAAVPVGPSSVHLLFSGLMGLLLGTLAIPAVLIALVLQAALFGFGGLTTLGINTVNIAFPGVILGALFLPAVRGAPPWRAGILSALCAALCVAATGGCIAASLLLSSSDFVPSAKIVLITYIPLMIAEAVITGFAVSFLKRARPDILSGAANSWS